MNSEESWNRLVTYPGFMYLTLSSGIVSNSTALQKYTPKKMEMENGWINKQ